MAVNALAEREHAGVDESAPASIARASEPHPALELQVVPWEEVDTIWDNFGNYELLDQSSNASSGSQLRSNIEAERRRLAAVTGDLGWLARPLRFTQVTVDSGASGQRWLRDEIRTGEHLDALDRHQRDR